MFSETVLLYVGTYTQPMSFVTGKGRGIYTCRFDLNRGDLEVIGETPAVNPSYLALHPSGRYLYAVSEVGETAEPTGDALSAYTLDPQHGIPLFLNQQPSRGASPCHMSVTRSGQFVCIATYQGADVAVYPIRSDGSLGETTSYVSHQLPGRTAHAHSITPDPSGCYVLVADLGLDSVFTYHLEASQGVLVPHRQTELPQGSGPRHLDFHPHGKFVYLINELNGTLVVNQWDAQAGILTPIQTLSTLPAGYSGPAWSADIHVHPQGRFVYGSNRGDHSLVIYQAHPQTGKLTTLSFESTRGKTPRSFVIHPDGDWLLVANQDSDNIAIFHIDPSSGLLEYLSSIALPTPVCLKFAVRRSPLP